MKSRSRNQGLVAFVTVGSTRFDALISKVLTDRIVDKLSDLGFLKIIIQAGKSEYNHQDLEALRKKMTIDMFAYKPSIREDIEAADLIVGHAGAGTCLEVLRTKKKLLIVANEQLMDNHQSELARELSNNMYAIWTTLSGLEESLVQILATNLQEFPQKNSIFEEVFNEALEKATARL